MRREIASVGAVRESSVGASDDGGRTPWGWLLVMIWWSHIVGFGSCPAVGRVVLRSMAACDLQTLRSGPPRGTPLAILAVVCDDSLPTNALVMAAKKQAAEDRATHNVNKRASSSFGAGPCACVSRRRALWGVAQWVHHRGPCGTIRLQKVNARANTRPLRRW